MEKIFVIGDSISCYYGKYLEQCLQGILEYDRKGGSNRLENLDDCTDGINGGDSSMVLSYLSSVIDMDFFAPDYLLLNCGIHDTKMPDGQLQIQPEQYKAHLGTILALAKQKEIAVIWVRTTPVNENTPQWEQAEITRRRNDIAMYNKIADEVMDANSIPIIDLYNFTRNLGPDIYLNEVDSVHFSDKTAQLQAAFIAGNLIK